MAEPRGGTELLQAPVDYVRIARMWVRSSMANPASFWMLMAGGALATGLEFVGIWLMFASIDSFGGFSLREIAVLYGISGLGLRLADMLIGSVEQLGQHVREGSLDVMLTRPVPLLVQVCADRFALRRIGNLAQSGAVLAFGAGAITWTAHNLALTGLAVVSSAAIFFAFFVGFSCLQLWISDSSEVANAFTYGGNTLTQYPLTIFPREVVLGLTFVLPVAFVNWYPALRLLGRPDPFGLPSWFAFLPPAVAVVLLALAGLLWRTGIRHYTSTGS